MKNSFQEKHQPQKQYSLCIVEDDSEVGNWLVNKLVNSKCFDSFYWAKNYRESENHLKRENPDCVILDIKLPDGNGIDILKMIKKEKPETKVVVFSANPEFKKACLRLGASAFYDKSTESAKLIEELKIPGFCC